MRVTSVINRFPPHHRGGYGLRFGDIVAGLGQRGHRTSVITSTLDCDGPRVDDGGIHRILELYGEVHGVRGILAFARSSAQQLAAVRRALDAEQPDVIHVGNFCELTSAIWAALRERGVPIVADVSNEWLDDIAGSHGNWFRIWERTSGSTLSRLGKSLLRLWVSSPFGGALPTRMPSLGIAQVYSTSSHWAATLTERYGDELGPIVICPSGIPIEMFPFRPSPRPFRRVLYVGRIKRFKGIHTPVRAVGRLPEEFTMTVVGIPDDPDYEAELKELAEEVAPGRVEFRPPVPRASLPDVFAEHDVLVFPTEGVEAFSRLIQEASACGLPVVATPNGGTAEAIDDGVNGRLYPPGDVDTLTSILAEIAGDDAQRQRLIETGRTHVERVYTIEPAIDRIERVLRGAVEAAGR